MMCVARKPMGFPSRPTNDAMAARIEAALAWFSGAGPEVVESKRFDCVPAAELLVSIGWLALKKGTPSNELPVMPF